MFAELSSSLGLFAVVWLAACVLSSAVVTEAMLRSNNAAPPSPSDNRMRDEPGHHAYD